MEQPQGEPLVVLITAGTAGDAERLAETLVREKLAACVNVLPGVTSLYRWQGAVQRDSEVLLIVKTRRPLLAQLTARVRALHSYHVPEIVALPIVAGSEPYLHWLAEATAA